MKTNGFVCARIRHMLPLLALLALAPAFSQVSFTSPGNLFTSRNNDFISVSENSNAEAIFGIRQRHTASAIFFPALQIENAGGNAGSVSQPETVTDFPIAEVNLPIADDYLPLDENYSSVKLEETKEIGFIKTSIKFKPTTFTYPKNSKYDIGVAQYSTEQLIIYAKELKQYAKKNGFDTTYAFLGNMGMLSNKKRFFVVNLVTMQIEMSGLVSHGRGQGSVFEKQYSNQVNSKCTSLGRYKISGKYKGGYGLAYKMIGLDSTNQNAYKRNIVLHSMYCIPDIENIMPACVSEGCPSVSTKFLASLTKIIDSRKKPVLLWLFDSNLEEIITEEIPVIDASDEKGYAKSTLKK
jgi:hypothetical protein